MDDIIQKMNLISVEDLIKKLKEENIDFGKGDPYNRLRYYTKIGWLPHMIRKKGPNNTNSGHYPIDVIDKIKEIEKYKDENLSNEEITEKLKNLNSEEKIRKLENILSKIKKVNLNIVFVLIIFLAFIYESSKTTNLINDFRNKNSEQFIANNQGNKSGISFIPEGQKKVFVENKEVKISSNIIISFNGNIFPATFYFISEIKDGLGFFVETNQPVLKETKFIWTILN